MPSDVSGLRSRARAVPRPRHARRAAARAGRPRRTHDRRARSPDAATLDGEKKTGSSFLYSTYESTAMKKLLAAFTRDTGCRRCDPLTSQPMFERVTAEYAAPPPAGGGLVDTTDITLTDQLAKRGSSLTITVRPCAVLPRCCTDDGGHWFMIVRSLMIIGVNTGVVNLPTCLRMTDLLDPRWKGKIGMASIDAGGTTYSAYFFLRQKTVSISGANSPRRPRARAVGRAGDDRPRAGRNQHRDRTARVARRRNRQRHAGEIVHPPAVRRHTASRRDHVDRTASARRAAWLDWITSKRGGAGLSRRRRIRHQQRFAHANMAGLTFPPASESTTFDPPTTPKPEAYTKEWHQIFARADPPDGALARTAAGLRVPPFARHRHLADRRGANRRRRNVRRGEARGLADDVQHLRDDLAARDR